MSEKNSTSKDNGTRFDNIDPLPTRMLAPIEGYESQPLVSLEEAIQPLIQIVPQIERNVDIVKENCEQPADDLTKDQSAAIMLYTHESSSREKSLYCILNNALRSEDRNKLKPWFLYLRLILTALDRLPAFSDHAIFRGVAGDLRNEYSKGRKFIWWPFSSCTSSLEVLRGQQFLPQTGPRTKFTIDSNTGKSIKNHSFHPREDEILLLPGRNFEVISCCDHGNDFYEIHLKEIQHKHCLLAPLPACDKYPVKLEMKQWHDLQFVDKHKTTIMKPDQLQQMFPNPSRRIEKKLFDRIAGSMLAMAMGDALGAHVAFRPYEYLRDHPVDDFQAGGTWGLEKGQFTNDTSMALCLANSLIACQGFNLYDQLVRYKWWYRHGYMSSTGKCFDIGNATRDAIEEFERRQKKFSKQYKISRDSIDSSSDPRLMEKNNLYCSKDGVAGNGALMRLAPVPLFFFRDPQTAVEYSGQSGQVTHGDRKVYDTCRYYGALIVAALHDYSKDQLLDDAFYQHHRHWFGQRKLHSDVLRIAAGSYKRKRGHDDGIRGGGYILKAMEAALWAFWSTKDFRSGAIAAVNLGDDTDRTAAIYGQLAGAFYGLRKLDGSWFEQIYAKEFLLKTSEWLGYEGEACHRKMQANGTLLSMLPDAPESSDTVDETDEPVSPPVEPVIPTPIFADLAGLGQEAIEKLSADEVCQVLTQKDFKNTQILEILRKTRLKGSDLCRIKEPEDLVRFGLTNPRDMNLLFNEIQGLLKQTRRKLNSENKDAIYLPVKRFFAAAPKNESRYELQPTQSEDDHAMYHQIRGWIGDLPDNIRVDRIELLQNIEQASAFIKRIQRAQQQKAEGTARSSYSSWTNAQEKLMAEERLKQLSKQVDHSHSVPIVRGWFGCDQYDVSRALAKKKNPGDVFTFASSAFYAARKLASPGCLIMSYLVLSDSQPVVCDAFGTSFRFVSGPVSSFPSSTDLARILERRVSSASVGQNPSTEDLKRGLYDEFIISDPDAILDYAVIYLKPATDSLGTKYSTRLKN